VTLADSTRPAAFAPLADALRDAVLNYYGRRGERLEGRAGLSTLETNSGLVERRGAPLRRLLREHAGIEDLDRVRLIDLGAGFGSLSIYFAACGASVTAIDTNASRLEVGQAVASSYDLPVRFLCASMQDLDLPSASFDVAVQNNSFCYLVDKRERQIALQETQRILRPGAWLVRRDPSRRSVLEPFTALPVVHLLPPDRAVAAARALGKRRSRVRLTSPRSACGELAGAGFVSVKCVRPVHRRLPARLLERYHHLLARRRTEEARGR
jgi:SAM-dependent methyltransferase